MASLDSFNGGVVEQLIVDDIETIAQQFQESFNECVKHVQKPNVLIAGVTGSGKSSLVNAVFGSQIAQVGDGIPVTEHYLRIEPPDKPVVIYDSKGLEDGRHEEFINDTRLFFETMRSKPLLRDHIHVVWYVINSACGRFEPFEEILIREIFAPTPVIFILNKSDVSSGSQLDTLETLIQNCAFENSKGIYRTVANRKNYSQSWCTECYSDDVMFKKKSNQLFCENCENVEVIKPTLNLGALIETTAELLPDLAKEAFLFSQVESLQDKDKRARELVIRYATNISMDVSGNALSEVGEMVGRIFVLWGWNFLGYKVSNSLIEEMKEEYKSQELSVRLAMIAADTILKRKLSRSVIACLGVMVNRPLRTLSEQLLTLVEKNEPIDVSNFDLSSDGSEEFADQFMKSAFEESIVSTIDIYWYD
eukprot:TRINITY_DN2236_c0_g7_i1.p1 TRINITY_DN2236_c0_g7~~TRINITY_DN2236_c0_g7_i1.p1  ORF type:complete len:431 (+),score=112.52 TRINITY_DN2236_c0_g7_i1:32-1294(+)